MLGSLSGSQAAQSKPALFHGLEETIVVVVSDLPAHGDSRSLVEGPVNTEVDAALAVVLFRFGKAGESLRDKRTNITLVILGHAVPLVGREGECFGVRPVKTAQDFEKRAAKRGVT